MSNDRFEQQVFEHNRQDGVSVIVFLQSRMMEGGTEGIIHNQLIQLLEYFNEPLVAFDLSRVEFLSSAAVGSLMAFIREVENRDGDYVLFGLQPAVKDILEMMRITSMVTIKQNQEEAIESLTKNED